MGGMGATGSATDLTGRLLVATPELVGPEFERTVILVLEHAPASGALGVVLNRPLGVPVAAQLPRWAGCDVLAEPAVLFCGGPVRDDSVLVLAVAHLGAELGDLRPVASRLVVLPVSVGPAQAQSWSEGVRVFAGYAGWGRGQLEGELAAGYWYVVDSEPSDVVQADPARLWRSVLRRQRGVHSPLALVATWTADPELN